VIRGHLDLLAESGGDRSAHATIAQVERLDGLVDRILTSVRDDRPEVSVRRTRFDLRATTTAALKELAPLLRRHKVRAPRAATTPLWVRGDRRKTAEVIGGLLHNATKYAPTGTAISIAIAKDGERATVRVADEGPGVAKEDRERIFHPFVRGNGAAQGIPGTGIGLYTCRRIVEAQGGRLWYEDANGHGAAFVFSLPAAAK